MSSSAPKILIYGMGNPHRGDDGIGPYCVEKILSLAKATNFPYALEGKAIFHLSIDELETAAKYSQVVLFDASMDINLINFSCSLVQPSACQQFTTHLLMPEEFLYSLLQLFNARPTMHLISIRGYYWEMSNTLSQQAKTNADSAIAFFFTSLIKSMN